MLPNGGQFTLPSEATEGIWLLDYRSEDPCHTFAMERGEGEEDLLPPEPFQTIRLIIDMDPLAHDEQEQSDEE